MDPHNESPWIYLLGYVKEQIRSGVDGSDELARRMVQESERLRDTVNTACPSCDSARIELLDIVGGEEERKQAAELAHRLGTVDDTIRTKFWARREGQLKVAMQNK